jgi:NitT/TauT family transport system substrate-binding protein
MAVMRRVSSALVIALAVLATPVAAPAQEKIRLGLIPISEALGAVIADKQGFFKAEGLDVDISKFESGATAVPVLQSGRLNVAL